MTAVIITIVVMYTDTIFEGNGYSANKTPTTGALLKTCEPPSAQKYTPPSENIQTRMHAIGRADLLHFLCHLSRSLPAARPGQCAQGTQIHLVECCRRWLLCVNGKLTKKGHFMPARYDETDISIYSPSISLAPRVLWC